MERIPVPVVRRIVRWGENSPQTVDDTLAEEAPLEIRLNGTAVAVTMRTPGHDDELAVGFLVGEGLLAPNPHPTADTNDFGVQIDRNRQFADVRTRRATQTAVPKRRTVTSACGICGRSSLADIATPAPFAHRKGGPILDTDWLRSLPDLLRDSQPDFESTGGIHAAALATPGSDVLLVREDVGRHNAVDKLIGNALLAGNLPLSNTVLLVSGRASFELVQKAVGAGIPALCAIGAPSSLAVDLASETDTTLIGFLRKQRFNIYAAPWRLRDWHSNHDLS